MLERICGGTCAVWVVCIRERVCAGRRVHVLIRGEENVGVLEMTPLWWEVCMYV